MDQILPCQPYIIRNLPEGEPEKAVEAGKNFYLKYLEAGLAEEDAYSFLLSLEQMSAVGTKRPSFFSRNGQYIAHKDYRDAVLSDRQLKRIPCETLYRRCDRQLSACRLCPVRFPFQESQLAMEKSVASFAFSGEQNFKDFLDAMKKQGLSIKDCFFIHVDISDILFLKKPYPAPALQLMMETLLENETVFFHGICAGEMESIRQGFFHKLEAFRRFPKEMKEKKDIRSILYAKVSSLLLTEPATAAQLDGLLSKMKDNGAAFRTGFQKEAEGEKEDTATARQSEGAKKLLNQFLDAANEPEGTHKPSSPVKAPRQDEKKTAETTGLEPDRKDSRKTAPPVEEITIEELLREPAPECGRAEKKDMTATRTKEKKKETTPGVSVTERHGSRPSGPENRPVPAAGEKAAAVKTEKKPSASAGRKKPEYVQSQLSLSDIGTGLPDGDAVPEDSEADHSSLETHAMYLPVISRKELAEYTKPLSTKEAYHLLNLAGKTGNLILEVFFDTGNIPVLILYDTIGKKFFHVQDAAASDHILLQMLGHKSIRKICVNPYTLYGYAYTFSCFAKNVFSFWGQGFLEPLFHKKKRDGLSCSLSLMTYYHDAAGTAKEPEPDRKLILDAAFGCSLMTNRFFRERIFLFRPDGDGKIQFQLPKKLTPIREGTFLTYRLTHSSDADTKYLFLNLLYVLCRQGRFKNIPFQLLYLDHASILFFVEADYLKRFDSICTIHLTELCEAESIRQALLETYTEQSYETVEKKLRQ